MRNTWNSDPGLAVPHGDIGLPGRGRGLFLVVDHGPHFSIASHGDVEHGERRRNALPRLLIAVPPVDLSPKRVNVSELFTLQPEHISKEYLSVVVDTPDSTVLGSRELFQFGARRLLPGHERDERRVRTRHQKKEKSCGRFVPLVLLPTVDLVASGDGPDRRATSHADVLESALEPRERRGGLCERLGRKNDQSCGRGSGWRLETGGE